MATFHYSCYVDRVDRSLCQVVGVDLDDDSYFLNLVKMDMITGARLSWWVIGLAKYPPALTGSSISLASEQALALRRWKSLKILKPLHLCRVSQKTHFQNAAGATMHWLNHHLPAPHLGHPVYNKVLIGEERSRLATLGSQQPPQVGGKSARA